MAYNFFFFIDMGRYTVRNVGKWEGIFVSKVTYEKKVVSTSKLLVDVL